MLRLVAMPCETVGDDLCAAQLEAGRLRLISGCALLWCIWLVGVLTITEWAEASFAQENTKLPTEWRFFFRPDELDDGLADWAYSKGNFKAADLPACVIAKDRASWKLLWNRLGYAPPLSLPDDVVGVALLESPTSNCFCEFGEVKTYAVGANLHLHYAYDCDERRPETDPAVLDQHHDKWPLWRQCHFDPTSSPAVVRILDRFDDDLLYWTGDKNKILDAVMCVTPAELP